MPAFESRRVRTHPFTVMATSLGALPARISAQLNAIIRNLYAMTNVLQSHATARSLGRRARLAHNQFPLLVFALHELAELRRSATDRIRPLRDHLLFDRRNHENLLHRPVELGDDRVHCAFRREETEPRTRLETRQ